MVTLTASIYSNVHWASKMSWVSLAPQVGQDYIGAQVAGFISAISLDWYKHHHCICIQPRRQIGDF